MRDRIAKHAARVLSNYLNTQILSCKLINANQGHSKLIYFTLPNTVCKFS